VQPITPRLVGASVIVLGSAEITPAASHLFALLLALSLSPHAAWTRRGLQDLLFGRAEDRTGAHRLRQLLYRLRGYGLELREDSSGVVSVVNPVADPLADAAVAAAAVAGGGAEGAILPLYAPRLPETFLEWLDEQRELLARRLTAMRASALRAARDGQDWSAALRIAAALHATEPHHEEWAHAAAEAQAMLGRRDDALDTIDRFVRESESELSAWPTLKRLRNRISTTRVPRREGTLRGRAECLAFLADQWETACAGGGGRACVILGAAGMGKTRVGETFAAMARLKGAQVFQHRCDTQGRQSPLSLFARLVPELRQRRGSIGADPSLASALDRFAPSDSTSVPDESSIEDRREELKRAIVDLLDAVSSEQPMLLVVDDAHLLDDPSRAVIHAIVQGANRAQVLVLLLCRPRSDGHSLLTPSSRLVSYLLPRLSDADSRALVFELVSDLALDEARVDHIVQQAGGNAFYLHALARHPCDAEELPLHIRSLAQTLYLCLSPEARTLLDASLLLDTLASTVRVTSVSSVNEQVLLNALRELEDSGLLRCEEGLLIGPHAILREALDALMPSTTRTVLHRRIATALAAECEDGAHTHVIGWAAVNSWLATGEADAAVTLALRLARNTAALGEPEAGALLLDKLFGHQLPIAARRMVLDELITLASAGHCTRLLSRTLKERMVLAVLASEGRPMIAGLVLQAAAVDHIAARHYDIAPLEAILNDTTLERALRINAIGRLMAVGDLFYDAQLATNAFSRLAALALGSDEDSPLMLRTQLVYHTTFGDAGNAKAIIARLLDRFPESSREMDCRLSRTYCLIGLQKLGYYRECAALGQQEWAFMNEEGHLFFAENAGAIAVDGYVAAGDFGEADRLMRLLETVRRNRPNTEADHSPVYYSSLALVAMHRGDYDVAEEDLRRLIAKQRHMSPPRLRAVEISLGVRLRQLRGFEDSQVEVTELESLFPRGARFNGQDATVEALWHVYSRAGQRERASTILSEYLAIRRELGPPEASLRRSTATDSAWRLAEPVAH
jgi:DNA-binding SARP family transcriptional activator/tetratricopeptide (TPR) repeat protein